MQKLIIAGNVGKDAVLRRTQGGEPVLGFSLAVDNGKDRDGNDRPATWYDCSLWGKRGESLSNHIKKGTKLVLEGRPTARSHEGNAYLGINIDELEFMGGGERQPRSQEPERDSYGNHQPANFSRDMDDDIPFAPEWR